MRDSTVDASGLVRLFTERRELYELPEARRLVGVSAERLEQAIAEGTIEVVSDGKALRIAWEDVVALALERWTPRQTAAILERAGAGHLVPPLNRFRTIEIALPAYQIRLLDHLAARRSTPGAPPLSASDVLEYELAALAFEEDLEAIDRAIPGFAAAASYPYPRARGK